MAVPPTRPGHAKIRFCFFGERHSLQAELPRAGFSGSGMILLLWTLPIAQICQDLELFSQLFPNFLSPMPCVHL